MISFHPALSPIKWLKYAVLSLKPSQPQKCFEALFPEHAVVLTDSGRSALALIIEQLGLSHKTMALPAYVCDALLPILKHYNIHPIFLDVSEENYQPPLSAYTDEVLRKADAVLLVATYGEEPAEEVLSLLKQKNKVIIEDYAACNPFAKSELRGAARLYSLQKTLPVPDGGLAIMPRGSKMSALAPHRLSLEFSKNVLKLLPLGAHLINALRRGAGVNRSSATWRGKTRQSNFSSAVLCDVCVRPKTEKKISRYSYCHPFRVANRKRALQLLLADRICAEPIWQNPLIFHPEARSLFDIDANVFPRTKKIAGEIVCVPLWHIQNEAEYQAYVKHLKEALAEELCQ